MKLKPRLDKLRKLAAHESGKLEQYEI